MATSRTRKQRRWVKLQQAYRNGKGRADHFPQKRRRLHVVNRASTATEFQQPVYKEPEKKPVVLQRPFRREPEHEVGSAWRPEAVMEPLPRPSPSSSSHTTPVQSGSARVLTDKKPEPAAPALGYTAWQLILNALLKVSSNELNCEELREATLGANDSGPNAFRDAVVFLKRKEQILLLGLKAGGRLSKSVRIRRVGFLSYDELV